VARHFTTNDFTGRVEDLFGRRDQRRVEDRILPEGIVENEDRTLEARRLQERRDERSDERHQKNSGTHDARLDGNAVRSAFV
jgi:hypothetical protein